VGAEQPGRERLGGAPQLGPGQRHRPGGRLDRHFPVAVAAARTRVLRQPSTGITVAAQELGDLGLQGCLHQQLRAEPGHLLQDLRQRPILSEQVVDLGMDAIGG